MRAKTQSFKTQLILAIKYGFCCSLFLIFVFSPKNAHADPAFYSAIGELFAGLRYLFIYLFGVTLSICLLGQVLQGAIRLCFNRCHILFDPKLDLLWAWRGRRKSIQQSQYQSELMPAEMASERLYRGYSRDSAPSFLMPEALQRLMRYELL